MNDLGNCAGVPKFQCVPQIAIPLAYPASKLLHTDPNWRDLLRRGRCNGGCGRLWPVQFWLVHFWPAHLVSQFGPIHFWPIHFEPIYLDLVCVCVMVGPQRVGLSCEDLAALGPPGLYTTAKNSKRAHLIQTPTKIPREDTQRETTRTKWELKRGKKREILAPPHPLGPHNPSLPGAFPK